MTTYMNTAIDNSKKNVSLSSFAVEGLSPLSPAAFAEFNKLRDAYQKKMDISNNWEYSPCFLMALREHFIAIEQQYDVECVESVILSMDWFFDGPLYQTFYRNSLYHQEIIIKQYDGIKELEPKKYNISNKQNLEVLRDLCLPMVYNW